MDQSYGIIFKVMKWLENIAKRTILVL